MTSIQYLNGPPGGWLDFFRTLESLNETACRSAVAGVSAMQETYPGWLLPNTETRAGFTEFRSTLLSGQPRQPQGATDAWRGSAVHYMMGEYKDPTGDTERKKALGEAQILSANALPDQAAPPTA